MSKSFAVEKLTGIFGGSVTEKVKIKGSYPALDLLFSQSDYSAGDIDIIREAFGSYCYSRCGDSLEKVVADLLRRKKATLSVAESITGGLIASTIVTVPGASEFFVEGFITYSNKAKTDRLGVDPQIIKSYGAVSPEVCVLMVRGAASKAGVDYALSTTGIAGPGGGTPGKDAGLCYIGLHSPEGNSYNKYQFSGSRDEVRRKAVIFALDLLRLKLEGYNKRLASFMKTLPGRQI
ncbi:MAG: nicotinamide-nucleotide amidohydrolase family protein [Candidatus Krumholzibacteriota bacterium]|nr:nicotinamide-nucleotide amidohydrolase family protein [Candidatus Krumholzibacteriota bacterium]